MSVPRGGFDTYMRVCAAPFAALSNARTVTGAAMKVTLRNGQRLVARAYHFEVVVSNLACPRPRRPRWGERTCSCSHAVRRARHLCSAPSSAW